MEPDWIPAPTLAGRRRSSRPFVIAAPDYTEMHGGVVALHRLCDRLNALGHEAFVVPLGSAEGITRTGWRTPLWDRGTLDDAVLVYPEIVTGNPLLGRRIVRWLLHRPSWFTGEGMSEGPDDLVVTFDTQIAPEWPVLRVPLVDPTVFFPKDAVGHGRLLWIGKGVLPVDFDRSGTRLITASWPDSRAGLAALLRSATVLYSCDWLTSLIDEALMCGTPVVLVGDQEWRRDEVVMRPGMTWAGEGEEAIDRATVAASAFYPRYLASLPDYDRTVEDFVQLVAEHFSEGTEPTGTEAT
ncbi:MAG TPA: hypothetical protein VMU76_04600 [Acidimicrobiales bacterium]|nr:hypothetical protein [Acidimicrobiales bacterium]